MTSITQELKEMREQIEAVRLQMFNLRMKNNNPLAGEYIFSSYTYIKQAIEKLVLAIDCHEYKSPSARGIDDE